MFSKINKSLRWLVVILGGVLALAKLINMTGTNLESGEEGFQIKEFDDIW